MRDVSWQRHVPWKFKKRRREIPISDGLIETIIEQDCSKSIAFIKAIALTGIKVFAIEGPRFFEHATYLKRKRIEVCADIEQRYRSYASQKLADVGIGVIEQPTQTITKIGTTHHDYRHPDPRDEHHGNAFMATWCATLSLIMQTALNNLLQPNTLHLDHQAKRPNTAHRPQTR